MSPTGKKVGKSLDVSRDWSLSIAVSSPQSGFEERKYSDKIRATLEFDSVTVDMICQQMQLSKEALDETPLDKNTLVEIYD